MAEFRRDIVTALVDDEVNDPVLKEEILSRIDSDESLAIDYKAQLLIKNLVKEKVAWKKTPSKVKSKVLKKIGSKTKVEYSDKSLISSFFDKPAFSFATAFVVILAIVLIVLNRPAIVEKKDFALEQSGNDNMYILAKSNFKKLLSGQFSLQLKSESPNEIKKFFSEQGVKYLTIVPEIENWKLLGAAIAEIKGEKFAHHAYLGNNGKLAYLLQVNEVYLRNNEVISLSDDLIKYLAEGNCYSDISEKSVSISKKIGDNIFVIVSDGNQSDLENTFCDL
jgi:hypothetical protein